MFTLEESAHLAAMLRYLGWTFVATALAVVGYVVLS